MRRRGCGSWVYSLRRRGGGGEGGGASRGGKAGRGGCELMVREREREREQGAAVCGTQRAVE